jgi:hypothetical protein
LYFGEIFGGEIGAGRGGGFAFAADLDYADDFTVVEDGRADNFVNGFAAGGGCFYAFEDGGVTHGGKIIINFGAAFAGGARGESGVAGERNEANIFQGGGDEEMEMSPAVGDGEDGNFVYFDAKFFGNFFRESGHGNFRRRGFVFREGGGELFEFGHEGRHNLSNLRAVGRKFTGRCGGASVWLVIMFVC